MEKIRAYKVQKRGKRGVGIMIPTAYAEDEHLKTGTLLVWFREGRRLILQPQDMPGEEVSVKETREGFKLIQQLNARGGIQS